MFDLKRPCSNCPFRVGTGSRFRLPAARVNDISNAVAFQCHKTVDYDRYDDADARSGDRPQQCAGLMAVLHRDGRPNQIMQVAERLGALDPSKLDPEGHAYAKLEDALAAHVEGREPRE